MKLSEFILRKRLKKHKRRIRKLEVENREAAGHRRRLGDSIGALEARLNKLERENSASRKT